MLAEQPDLPGDPNLKQPHLGAAAASILTPMLDKVGKRVLHRS
jgi:hypothetical protein